MGRGNNNVGGGLEFRGTRKRSNLRGGDTKIIEEI